ncbi:MAG: YggS family pyridoxal phosphate-dependent enzyme [Deltaproteobacteria bacterium]|nr:YggS family pyridoxal phosphate-dependent enzyme [Deltaproteobacteria bacterium]
MTITEKVQNVAERISWAAARAGRRLEDVKLVAITKTVDVDLIRAAADAGVRIFGENYVQEAKEKIAAVGKDVEWHMTGHLQKNKARDAVNMFSMVQTIDSLGLAEELDKRAGAAGKVILGLIEVNLGEERSKSGVSKDELIPFLNSVKGLKNLSVRGLMAIPPFFDEPEKVRPYFKALRELRDRANAEGFSLSELSMGMSHDFEVAVEEGATMVRIGTAIFGERG